MKGPPVTVASAPDGALTRNPGLGPIARAGLAAVVVLGPLSIAALRGILPYDSADDATAIATKVAAHQGVQELTLWLTPIAMATLVPGVIAVGTLALRSSRTLGAWGLTLAVAGYSLLWATTALDFAALAAARSGIGIQATAELLDSLNGSVTQIVPVAVFVLGHIVGTVLIGVALLRARAIPRWAVWMLIISQPLHLVFAVIVPVHALDAGAWLLTAIGFAAALPALLRPTS